MYGFWLNGLKSPERMPTGHKTYDTGFIERVNGFVESLEQTRHIMHRRGGALIHSTSEKNARLMISGKLVVLYIGKVSMSARCGRNGLTFFPLLKYTRGI